MSVTASVYKKRFLQKRTVLAVVESLFWQLGTHFNGRCRCRELAVVERFKQELMYGLSAGTKKCGRCREVAVVERWTLVEVRLYKCLLFVVIWDQPGNLHRQCYTFFYLFIYLFLPACDCGHSVTIKRVFVVHFDDHRSASTSVRTEGLEISLI